MDSSAVISAPLGAMERVVATDEICQLKYCWWAAVDNQKWGDILNFVESPETPIDIGMRFPGGKRISTAREFVEFCSSNYYIGKRALHLGLNPIITFTSSTEAEAVWTFEAVEYEEGSGGLPGMKGLHVWGYHNDRYVMTANGWRIASIMVDARCVWSDKPLPPLP